MMGQTRGFLLPPFVAKHHGKIVFARFREARHQVLFDVSNSVMEVDSYVTFETFQRGKPVIDLSPEIGDDVEVDGKLLKTVELSAPRPRWDVDVVAGAAPLRAVRHDIEPGLHVAQFRYKLERPRGVEFSPGEVRCFFAMSDYHAAGRRHFLERYLPANFEFDQHPVQIDVEIAGTRASHLLLANGEVTGDEATRWSVCFPAWYTSSCPFFYLAPRERLKDRLELDLPRRGGGSVRTTIFRDRHAVNLGEYAVRVGRHLQALQADLGPFPHDKLLLMAGEPVGMEYAGAATVTSGTLLHELVHSYFGRSVLPRDGDAGWIDEAIAHWYEAWRPGGMNYGPEPRVPRNMGAWSPYRRHTVAGDGAYGKALLGYVDGAIGGRLIDFLADLHQRYARQTIDSRSFQTELERFAGRSFSALFDRCVYGHR